jgi:hypothetical protein
MRNVNQKTIKNIIKQYLREQEDESAPRRGRGGDRTTPEDDNSILVPITAEIFKGIESILGKVSNTVKNGVMYVPDKIMEKYEESLKQTRYRYMVDNKSVDFTYNEIGNQISDGNVKLNTPVKRMLYNSNTKRTEPGPTKKASEYPELKEFFWGDESQIEAEKTKQVENEAEKTRQLEILRGYVNKGVFGKNGVDFEEITITTLPGYYIGIKLLNPREGKTVVLLYDNKISIMNPNNTLSSPTPNIENNGTSGQDSSTKTSGIIKRQGDPYEYKVESDNWLAKKTGTQKWFNITGVDFKPAYQQSIDILDTENPKLRTANAPKRTK